MSEQQPKKSSPPNKNNITNSSLEAGGNIHVGDVTYHGVNPEAITLSRELQTLKAQLSV